METQTTKEDNVEYRQRAEQQLQYLQFAIEHLDELIAELEQEAYLCRLV